MRVERIHILIRPLPKKADQNQIRALLLSFTDASMLGNWRLSDFSNIIFFLKFSLFFPKVFCYGRHAGCEFYTTVTSGLDICMLNPPSMIHNFHKKSVPKYSFLNIFFFVFLYVFFFKFSYFFRIFKIFHCSIETTQDSSHLNLLGIRRFRLETRSGVTAALP